MSAHTLSVGLWVAVETLHSVLATTTALVITYLKHTGREEPWMREGRERMRMHYSECLSACIIVIVKSVSMGMHKLYNILWYIFIIKYNQIM